MKNVVVIGASYAGKLNALHPLHPLRLALTPRLLVHRGIVLVTPTGARAAEMLAKSLPETHRVVLIDRQRCAALPVSHALEGELTYPGENGATQPL